MIQDFSIAFSLVLIVVLVMKRVNYGLAMLVGTVVLGILSGLPPQQFSDVFTMTLLSISTLELVLIVTLIQILAYSMKKSGMIDEAVEGIRKVLSGKAVLTVMPALMGSLPMIGGALLSAPLIDREAERLGLSREERSFINVWFRHWSFFINPLSSTMILLASLTGFNLYSLVLLQVLPVTIYLILGYFVSIRKIPDNKSEEDKSKTKERDFLLILHNISPIIITVFLNIMGLNMVVSLAVGTASVILLKKAKVSMIWSLLRNGFDWRLSFTMFGVMCFRYMVEASGSVSSLLPYIEATALTPNFILIVVSWVVGAATAMPTAGIAIIIPMAKIMVENLTLALVSILYLSMVFSYIVSPMHLCLILTVEYYKSRLQTVYRKLIPTAMITYAIILVIILTTQSFV